MKTRLLSPSASLAWTLVLVLSVAPCGAAAKKPLSYDAYDGWRSIQGTRLSRDGVWLVYALVPQDGDGELVVRNLETGAEKRHPRGKDPVISADGRYVAFAVAAPKAEIDKARKAKKKPEDQPKPGLGVMDLSTGEVLTAERVKSFKLPEDGGSFMAFLLEPPARKADARAGEEKKEETKTEEGAEGKKEKKKDPGSDLVILEPGTGARTTVPEVTDYVWSKNGDWIAYVVSSNTPDADGAYARRPSDGTLRTLLSGQGHYKGPAFDDSGSRLAFVSDRDDYKADASPFRLYLWAASADAATEVVSRNTPGIPSGYAVSENGQLDFSKDGTRLFFGTAAVPEPEPKDAPEPLKVDLWHWKDPELQSMQKVRAEDEKKRSYRAVFHVESKQAVQLAGAEMPTVTLVEEGNFGLGASDVPYRQLVSWDGSYSDYYTVDLRNGERRRVLEKQQFGATLSPGGGYVLFFDAGDSQWHSVRLADGRKFDLTGKLGVRFEREDWDTPDQPRPYGSAGWTGNDRSVLLYDRYDIWEVRPDGTAPRNLTLGAGRKGKRVFRYLRLDPEEKVIPSAGPLLLSTTDEETMASGFHTVSLSAGEGPKQAVMLDKNFGAPIKARNSGRMVFTLSRFEEFPDLWVTGGTFADMKKVSDANPQQAEYFWGRSELIEYRNADGRILRGILTKPEDFDPSRKYPLMVYIYEELSRGLHRYVPPAPGTSINLARYVSNGYVLLQPDIVYDTGYPGESAMKCVIPAVQSVVGMGFIDPARIGIQGHSWGGYQISYMITRTNLFRAVEAGASVVNMISAYGGIRWGSGMSRAFQYEKTQSRIGAPPWLRPLQFIENSPIFWVEKVQTPYLTIANDEDDAVPWYQGIEFFTALRHLGKEAYMFNYNTEKHGLRQRENQKHWTVHLDEFFDHHLKGAPLPEWMQKGVPYLERGRRDVSSLFAPSSQATQ